MTTTNTLDAIMLEHSDGIAEQAMGLVAAFQGYVGTLKDALEASKQREAALTAQLSKLLAYVSQFQATQGTPVANPAPVDAPTASPAADPAPATPTDTINRMLADVKAEAAQLQRSYPAPANA